jgi:hypothetical protein
MIATAASQKAPERFMMPSPYHETSTEENGSRNALTILPEYYTSLYMR